MAKEVDEGADASCCCCCDVDGGGAEVASSWVYVVVAADGAMGIEALVLGLDLSRGRVSQLYSLGSRHQRCHSPAVPEADTVVVVGINGVRRSFDQFEGGC